MVSLHIVLRPGAWILTATPQAVCSNRAIGRNSLHRIWRARIPCAPFPLWDPDGSTVWLSFLISFDGTLAQNTADIRIDGKNGDILVGRELDDEANWSMEDLGSPTPYTQSSVPIVTGQALFVAMRIDQNVDPNANDTVTIYFDPHPAAVPSATPGVAGIVYHRQNFNTSNVQLAVNGSAFTNH